MWADKYMLHTILTIYIPINSRTMIHIFPFLQKWYLQYERFSCHHHFNLIHLLYFLMPYCSSDLNHHCPAAANCLRRPSPKEVQSLMRSHQQAHPALLKLGKRPKKSVAPPVKPTSKHLKKSQSPHQQTPVPNRYD